MDNVAITGRGVISSLGHDIDQFGCRLMAGEPSVMEAPWGHLEGLHHPYVSGITDFDATQWIESRLLSGIDVFAQYAVAAAVNAVEDSGVELEPERTAVVMGTSMAGVASVCESQRGYDREGAEGVSRKLQLQAWANMGAGQIALRWKLHGPLLTVSTACASSLDALGLAARMIETGQADIAIAGGCEYGSAEMTHLSAARFGMTGPADGPDSVCRPFDRDRVGILPGQGAGVVVLERADHARARGAMIHGRILGYASLSDGFHPSSPDPSGRWEKRTMELALREADLTPNDVDAIVAHGTGTLFGDAAEATAINELFEGRSTPVGVTSVKGHIGHTGGAAGVMNLLAALHSMERDALVPVAATQNLDPMIQFEVPIRRTPLERTLEVMQINGFGFGGQDASIVLCRH